MKIFNVFVEGTLGDSYIVVLKLMKIGKDYDLINVFHKTEHRYWYGEISNIYSLFDKIRLTFVEEKPYPSILEVSSPDKHIETTWFPDLNLKTGVEIDKPYTVLLSHSGKPNGGNTKRLHPKDVQNVIGQFDNVVLLGTNGLYRDIDASYNLIGKTTILDAIALTSKAETFIGPEGLLSFVAISHKIRSTIFYTSLDAVMSRIVGTPWGKYCNLQKMRY
uniref:Glycosyltransferase n=1 Tax=viral metagenome TaxID=1070528 RepID=A0A6M3JHK2_9ZZZZ